MTLIDMILDVATSAGAADRPVSIRDLFNRFRTESPDRKDGTTVDSFAATLNLHCINMQSRFPSPLQPDKTASWLTRPLFKRIGRGQYMLLSETELNRFRECVQQRLPVIYQSEYDVADLWQSGDTVILDRETDSVHTQPPKSLPSVRPAQFTATDNARWSDPAVIEAMRRFVQAFENCRDIAHREEPGRPELELPVRLDGPQATHYLLMAAAIDLGTDSNHIRPFLVRLHRAVAGGLFAIDPSHAKAIRAVIASCQADGLLGGWQAQSAVPRILADVNAFVEREAEGSLDSWAKQFKEPTRIVDCLARSIYYQGRDPSGARKKMWMFLRWVVRPAPDLRLWTHLSPRDLMIPVDRHIARVAKAVGLISDEQARNPARREVETITDWARRLFPEDPACADYAFFLLGLRVPEILTTFFRIF